MIPRRKTGRPRGYTLVELVASLAGAAALVAAMGATMGIALKASDPAQTPAAGIVEASQSLADLAGEAQYALAVTEAAATAFTVTVPDRNDADAVAETIRYAWSGVSGAPLTRQYNGGSAVAVVPSVASLAIEYRPSAAAPKFVTVRLRRTADSRTTVETAFQMLNLP
jgi:acetylornithine deacetylase/succinyl-diaminopimelate desuccinylase-like protein